MLFNSIPLHVAMTDIFKQEIIQHYRQKSLWLFPILFFSLVVVLFSVVLPHERQSIRLVAPALCWVTCLLSFLLSQESLFKVDAMEGSLEQLTLYTLPLPLVLLSKILAHWILQLIPLLIISPILLVALQLPLNLLPVIILGFTIGTPLLCALGSISALFTNSLKQGTMLLALLCLPWYVPVLIFGVMSIEQSLMGIWPTSELAMLAAMSILALTLAPFAAAYALRVHLML